MDDNTEEVGRVLREQYARLLEELRTRRELERALGALTAFIWRPYVPLVVTPVMLSGSRDG